MCTLAWEAVFSHKTLSFCLDVERVGQNALCKLSFMIQHSVFLGKCNKNCLALYRFENWASNSTCWSRNTANRAYKPATRSQLSNERCYLDRDRNWVVTMVSAVATTTGKLAYYRRFPSPWDAHGFPGLGRLLPHGVISEHHWYDPQCTRPTARNKTRCTSNSHICAIHPYSKKGSYG